MALHNSSCSSPPSAATNGDSSASDKLIFAPPNSQFSKSSLQSADLSPSPFTQFHTWFSSAVSSRVPSPETAVLSTASLPSGRVSGRAVYLKELSPTGFILYSNFGTSRKAADLRTNPWAALTFFWREQERQVRVEGVTERLSVEESQVYFNTRVRGSKVGAWASEQSSVLKGREELESRVKEVEEWFKSVEEIPVPTFWGGLRIRPVLVEFWQGRESRLHDRFVYTRESMESEDWKVERLSP
ncbi:pyridoxamine 5'-phosphate oxidase [Trichophaea hybrida]|nr:pyridoxamine 5'-phosphate oxidase [Trichophaea hybrida]